MAYSVAKPPGRASTPKAHRSHPIGWLGRRETISAPNQAKQDEHQPQDQLAGREGEVGVLGPAQVQDQCGHEQQHRHGEQDQPSRAAVRALTWPPPEVGSFLIHDDRRQPSRDRYEQRTTPPAGGEQAANALQLGSSSRHTTTPDAKVRGTIEASPLVRGRRCLRSHPNHYSPLFLARGGPWWGPPPPSRRGALAPPPPGVARPASPSPSPAAAPPPPAGRSPPLPRAADHPR